MTWNYRIIKHDAKKPYYYAVHEVFYDENGNVTSWTENPIDITGDSKKEVMKSLGHITSDTKLPVLNESKLLDNLKTLKKDDDELSVGFKTFVEELKDS